MVVPFEGEEGGNPIPSHSFLSGRGSNPQECTAISCHGFDKQHLGAVWSRSVKCCNCDAMWNAHMLNRAAQQGSKRWNGVSTQTRGLRSFRAPTLSRQVRLPRHQKYKWGGSQHPAAALVDNGFHLGFPSIIAYRGPCGSVFRRREAMKAGRLCLCGCISGGRRGYESVSCYLALLELTWVGPTD